MTTSKINKHDCDDSLITREEFAYLSNDVIVIKNNVSALQNYVNYSDADIVGVEVDFKNNIVTRLAGAVGHEAADSLFNNFKAFGGRKRCVLKNDGTVVAYYGDAAYTATDVVNSGQVMVEQPAFYYRTEPLELEAISDGIGFHLRKARYYISNTPREGFCIHPAFKSGEKVADKIYVAAYRGSLFDSSANAWCKNDSAAADSTADLLCSGSGAKPASGAGHSLTRDICRKIASKRGTGWQIRNVQMASMTQLLFLVEYASMNIQNKLGAGHTNGTWNNTNDAQATGSTNNLGNTSGQVTNSSTGLKSVSYRGEEDLFGMWEFIDGLNIDLYGRHIPYAADHDYADNKLTDNYQSLGFTAAKAQGYLSAIGYSEKCDWAFMASEVAGNSNGIVGDYFWNNPTGQFVAIGLLGGGWDCGVGAGLGCWYWNNSSGGSVASVGARLAFMPQ